MKEPENSEKNARLRESVEEDYGYPLYPERKNPELYKEYTMIGRRSVKVIEKQTVKCFTHCESEFPRMLPRVLFSSVALERGFNVIEILLKVYLQIYNFDLLNATVPKYTDKHVSFFKSKFELMFISCCFSILIYLEFPLFDYRPRATNST